MPNSPLKQKINAFKAKYGTVWQLGFGMAALVLISVTAVIGYMMIEGWSFLDSFYMMVITLSTVGYMEVRPMTDFGRIWTSCIILGGVGSFMFMAGVFSQVLIEGKLQKILVRYRVRKTISKLRGHFIICGYGRIGSIVAREIINEGHTVVVIEQNVDLIHKMEDQGVFCLQGDATSDTVLTEAGIDKAKALITALTDEAANVYVTLTVRQMAPDLNIIARAGDATHVPRLEMAGADQVILPNLLGGIRMAQSVLRPNVTNFVELAMNNKIDLQMEEMVVNPKSDLVGKDLIASEIRPRFNAIIIAIKSPDGHMIFNPGPKEVIRADDTLLVVGETNNLKKLEAII